MAAWGDHEARASSMPAPRREPVNLAGVGRDPLDGIDFDAFTYYACSVCGHVETRQAVVEAPRECEHCRAHSTALVSFGDLDAAEAFSDEL